MNGHPTPVPPPEEFPPEEILIGRRAAWLLTGFFLLLLAVPPMLDHLPGRLRELTAALTGKSSSQPIAGRLRAYDASVASAPFTAMPREWTQQALAGWLEKGNDRVVIGKDDWLFYRPEIQALTGYGPLAPEPHSVSRDPALLDWEAPLGPIRDFASQLHARGVTLWLVPVPMKPAIYPEMLTGRAAGMPLRHPDAAAFYAKLAEAGVEVQDLAPLLWAAKAGDAAEGPVYLKDDTHWTTRGMGLAAGYLAGKVREQPWTGGQLGGPPWEIVPQDSVSGYGDLVEKLGLRHPEQWAPPREELLGVIPAVPDGKAMPDPHSPVVVIGDSFVNLFDDPGLGFGRKDGAVRSQAGFAWHLAARLGMGLDVHAVNGEGASGVRRWLARRGESVVRSKKLVIWVIAERDLLLSRSVAKANRVSWDHVTFAPDPPGGGEARPVPAGPILVEAEVLEKPELADPARANYKNALFTVHYRIRKTVSGAPVSGDCEVVHWHFRERMPQPTSRVEIGQVYRLNLEPWAAKGELQPINREELGAAAPPWWSATADPVP